MPERREVFDDVARRAIKAGDRAKLDLAGSFAGEIQSDLASFDPRRLRVLGPDRLRTLLRTLEMPVAPDTQKQTVDDPDLNERDVPQGWAHMRRPEDVGWLYSTAFGALVGAVVIFAGGAVRLLLG